VPHPTAERLWAIAGWSSLGLGRERSSAFLPPGGGAVLYQPLPAACSSCVCGRLTAGLNSGMPKPAHTFKIGEQVYHHSGDPAGGTRTGPYTIIGLLWQSESAVRYCIKSATREQGVRCSGFQTHDAERPRQPQDAEVGSEALLGMRSQSAAVAGPMSAASLRMRPTVQPVAAMTGWHVVRGGGVLAVAASSRVHGDPLALDEDLHGAAGEPTSTSLRAKR
jgi:hypothetical protein